MGDGLSGSNMGVAVGGMNHTVRRMSMYQWCEAAGLGGESLASDGQDVGVMHRQWSGMYSFGRQPRPPTTPRTRPHHFTHRVPDRLLIQSGGGTSVHPGPAARQAPNVHPPNPRTRPNVILSVRHTGLRIHTARLQQQNPATRSRPSLLHQACASYCPVRACLSLHQNQSYASRLLYPRA